MKRVAAVVAALLLSVPANASAKPTFQCRRWHKLAIDVGFKVRDLPELDHIMYRESRCNPAAKGLNKNAYGKVWSIDRGLMQINDYSWVTYLRNQRIIKTSDDLYNPRTNLRAAKALYDYSVSRGYTPWAQWRSTSGSGSGH